MLLPRPYNICQVNIHHDDISGRMITAWIYMWRIYQYMNGSRNIHVVYYAILKKDYTHILFDWLVGVTPYQQYFSHSTAITVCGQFWKFYSFSADPLESDTCIFKMLLMLKKFWYKWKWKNFWLILIVKSREMTFSSLGTESLT